MEDKKRGCMYGLAIGDALGAAVEFRQPGEFEPVVGYRGFGPHGLDAGEWTDDTSMALALADSIANGWSMKDQMERYFDWFQNGKYSVNGMCFDIGNTTRQAMYQFENSGSYKAENNPDASGNGSIMRLAPVVIRYCEDVGLHYYLMESSETTHGSSQCTDSCLALGIILKELMLGKSKEDVLSPELFKTIPLCALVREVVNGSYKQGKNIQGSGWVIKSLEAGLWAFYSSNSFEETVLKAVNLGDDSDTTGAVAGQLAGAYWGYSAIPKALIDGLAKKEMIEKYLVPIL